MARHIELSISCQDCVRRATPDCTDCLVSHVLGAQPDHLELTSSDVDAAELFAAEGLIPHLRFVRDETVRPN